MEQRIYEDPSQICPICGGDCSSANPPPINCPRDDWTNKHADARKAISEFAAQASLLGGFIDTNGNTEEQRQTDINVGRQLYQIMQGSQHLIGGESKTMLIKYHEIGSTARVLVTNRFL